MRSHREDLSNLAVRGMLRSPFLNYKHSLIKICSLHPQEKSAPEKFKKLRVAISALKMRQISSKSILRTSTRKRCSSRSSIDRWARTRGCHIGYQYLEKRHQWSQAREWLVVTGAMATQGKKKWLRWVKLARDSIPSMMMALKLPQEFKVRGSL